MKLFDTTVNSKAIERLRLAVCAKDVVQGYTHNYYRYPARFSPKFVREVIQTFSKPGDVILDPFVGGGTTLVEALASNRHSIGFDVSPIGTFVSKTKTTLISANAIKEIELWSESVLAKKIAGYKPLITYYDDHGYLNNLPWRIKSSVEVILNEIENLNTEAQQQFAKCVVLRTAQWAVDCRENIPSAKDFRKMFAENLKNFSKGMRDLTCKVEKNRITGLYPFCYCFNDSSENIGHYQEMNFLPAKPKLIITSPPYVGVHMVYHQWQVQSRKRTRTPFWIIDSLDGMGSSHYTFGYYKDHGKKKYFEIAENVFKSIHPKIDDEAIIVQLVGFSDHKRYLPKYLDMMDSAGYKEVDLMCDIIGRVKRIWRDVPNRKWYVKAKNDISSSKEVLLIHRKK